MLSSFYFWVLSDRLLFFLNALCYAENERR